MTTARRQFYRRCTVCNGDVAGYKRRICDRCRKAVDPTNLMIDRVPRRSEPKPSRSDYRTGKPKIFGTPSLPKFKCLDES